MGKFVKTLVVVSDSHALFSVLPSTQVCSDYSKQSSVEYRE